MKAKEIGAGADVVRLGRLDDRLVAYVVRGIAVVLSLAALVATALAGSGWGRGESETHWGISDLGWNGSAIDVNERGLVVGDGFPPSTGAARDWAGYAWRDGRLIDLGVIAPAKTGYVTVHVRDVNDRGEIVGVIATLERGRNGSSARGFVWSNGRMRMLRPLAGDVGSEAVAVNGDGDVVGISVSWIDPAGVTPRRTRRQAVVWRQGVPQGLGTLGGVNSEPAAINDDGQVVGTAETRGGLRHAFLWQKGRMTDVGVLPGYRTSKAVAVDGGGVVVANSYRDSAATVGTRAFVWQKGRRVELGAPRDATSLAVAVNRSGQVVGTVTPSSGGARVFSWLNGVFKTLPVPTASSPFALEADGCSARAISNQGLIVGSCGFQTAFTHAALWTAGTVTDLGALSPEDEAHADALAVSDRGQIVGVSQNRMDVPHAVLWTKGS